MRLLPVCKTMLQVFAIVTPLFLLSFSPAGFEKPKVLVFSKTEGFRHASIEAGKKAFEKMAAEKGFTVDFY